MRKGICKDAENSTEETIWRRMKLRNEGEKVRETEVERKSGTWECMKR